MADAIPAATPAKPRESSPPIQDIAPVAPPVLAVRTPPKQPKQRPAPAQKIETRTFEGARQATLQAFQRYRTVNQAYLRQAQRWEEEQKRFRRQTRRTNILIVLGALIIAAIADLLSIVDAGWLISWSIPLICFFVARRIDGINRAVASIHLASNRYDAESQALQERLGPALREPGAPSIPETPRLAPYRYRPYLRMFVVESVLVQGIELIPVIDVLPLYLGQVVRVVIKQYASNRSARMALRGYAQSVRALDRLRRFEVEYLLRKVEQQYQAAEYLRSELQASRVRAEPTTSEPAPSYSGEIRDVAFAT